MPTRVKSGQWNRKGSRVEPADFAVVARALNGEKIPMNMHERREVIRILNGRGMALKDVSSFIGLNSSTVAGHLRAIRSE